MNNPWLGFQTYEENESFKFKGRDSDILKIFDLVKSNRISVLYSDSGIGKSSIINAGLTPLLKKRQYYPINIRLEDKFLSGEINIDNFLLSMIERSTKSFMDLHKNSEVKYEIIFAENFSHDDFFLCHIDKELKSNLWWKLHAYELLCVIDDIEYPLKPIFIFDQFEELFTKCNSLKRIGSFFNRIRELISDTPPIEVLNIHSKLVEEGIPTTELPSSAGFNAIFSLRREYLANLEYWTNQKDKIYGFLNNRYFLMPLDREQSIEVITGQDTTLLNPWAENIIKELDSLEEQIPPILLSVMCYELYEISKKRELEEHDINSKDLLHRAYENVVKSTYKENEYDKDGRLHQKGERIITDKKVWEIESLLVNKSGHRTPVDVHELGLSKYQLDFLKSHLILKLSSEVGKVELMHDRIADIINDNNIHQRNVITNTKLRLELENVLLCFGRLPITNCEYICEDDDNVYSMLETFTEINKQSSRGNEKTSLKSLLQDSYSLKNDICISFIDRSHEKVAKGIICKAIDDIAYISVRYSKINITYDNSQHEELKIYKILFFDEKNEKPFMHRLGYYGIKLEYDDRGNEILRTYIDEKGDPIINYRHFAQIKREYNENNLPVKTSYLDELGNPIKHKDGNYGFMSDYNIDGQEILRTFTDKDGFPTRLKNGIYAQKYEYERPNSQNKTFILNLDKNYKPTRDIGGYEGAIQEFDEYGNCISYSYCDANKKLIVGADGYSKQIYTYNTYNQISIVRYLDCRGSIARHRDGYYGQTFDYNLERRPVTVTVFDELGNPTICAEGYSQLQREYDKCGREIRNSFYDKGGFPCYIGGVFAKEIKYDERTGSICSIISVDENGLEVDENGQFSRHEFCYDNNGVLKKLSYFDSNKYSTQPYVTIEYTQQENSLIVEKTTNCLGEVSELEVKRDAFNANRVVYERDIIKENFYHHLKIEYDRDGYRHKEYYLDINDNPCLTDIVTSGREIVYDNLHNQIGEAHIDSTGNRIRCSEGYCICISTASERSYWDTDAITPLCSKEGYHKCIRNNTPDENGFLIKYFNTKQELCDGPEGFSVLKEVVSENTIHRYFLDCQNRKCKLDWAEERRQILENGDEVTEYYDENSNPIDCDGYHRKYTKRKTSWYLADVIIKYTSKEGKCANGENPLDNSGVKGSEFWLKTGKDGYEIKWARNKEGKSIIGSKKIVLYNYALWTVIPLLFIYLIIVECFKWIIGKFMISKKDSNFKEYVPVIMIKEVFPEVEDRNSKGNKTIPLCFKLGLQEGDIILSYDTWNYNPKTDWDVQVNNFEKIFNETQDVTKRVVVARKKGPQGQTMIKEFWAPANNIGCRIIDDSNTYSVDDIEDIFKDYEIQQQQQDDIIKDNLFNTYSTNPLQKLILHKRYALFYLEHHNMGEAYQHIKKAINYLEKNKMNDNMLICETYRAASLVFIQQSLYEESLVYAFKSNALLTKLLNNENCPSNSILYKDILLIVTYLCHMLGNYESAKEYYDLYMSVNVNSDDTQTLFMKEYIKQNEKDLL
ncbi:MAG: hypothetical protein KBT06_09830 [Prevotellaceae bacterium]|nr:hypothetical protein [Candidatus Colivivens equi]